eukprot:gene2528-4917_t
MKGRYIRSPTRLISGQARRVLDTEVDSDGNSDDDSVLSSQEKKSFARIQSGNFKQYYNNPGAKPKSRIESLKKVALYSKASPRRIQATSPDVTHDQVYPESDVMERRASGKRISLRSENIAGSENPNMLFRGDIVMTKHGTLQSRASLLPISDISGSDIANDEEIGDVILEENVKRAPYESLLSPTNKRVQTLPKNINNIGVVYLDKRSSKPSTTKTSKKSNRKSHRPQNNISFSSMASTKDDAGKYETPNGKRIRSNNLKLSPTGGSSERRKKNIQYLKKSLKNYSVSPHSGPVKRCLKKLREMSRPAMKFNIFRKSNNEDIIKSDHHKSKNMGRLIGFSNILFVSRRPLPSMSHPLSPLQTSSPPNRQHMMKTPVGEDNIDGGDKENISNNNNNNIPFTNNMFETPVRRPVSTKPNRSNAFRFSTSFAGNPSSIAVPEPGSESEQSNIDTTRITNKDHSINVSGKVNRLPQGTQLSPVLDIDVEISPYSENNIGPVSMPESGPVSLSVSAGDSSPTRPKAMTTTTLSSALTSGKELSLITLGSMFHQRTPRNANTDSTGGGNSLGRRISLSVVIKEVPDEFFVDKAQSTPTPSPSPTSRPRADLDNTRLQMSLNIDKISDTSEVRSDQVKVGYMELEAALLLVLSNPAFPYAKEFGVTERILESTLHLNRVELEKMCREHSHDHPDVIAIKIATADLYKGLGMPEECEKLLLEVIESQRKLFGSNYSDLHANMNDLGLLFMAMHKYAEAQALFEDVVTLVCTSQGAEHPDAAAALGNLAVALRKQSNFDASLTVHERAVFILNAAYGFDYPDTAYQRALMGITYISMGATQKGKRLIKEAYINFSEMHEYSSYHPWVLMLTQWV